MVMLQSALHKGLHVAVLLQEQIRIHSLVPSCSRDEGPCQDFNKTKLF